MESHNEFGPERKTLKVNKLVRQICLPLLIAAACVSFSFAQDSQFGSYGNSNGNGNGNSNSSGFGSMMNGGNNQSSNCSTDQSSNGPSMRMPTDSSGALMPPVLTAPGGMGSANGNFPGTMQTPSSLNPFYPKLLEQEIKPHTEFEQIVADTIGRALAPYGASLFQQPPSTFAPTDHVQVPSDYVIGPDDELQIRVWGQLNADLRVVVDRSGQIFIPRVGQIPVAGVHYSDLDELIRQAILKTYHNFTLTVSIGRIRAIQVYVVGQAKYPGTYTVSSLSTLVNAIFASGGPDSHGSLRDIQVQRDGKTIAHMDLYDLLVKGDKSKDVRLKNGDVLYFPPVGPLVAIGGSINTPAIYEVKRDSSLADLVEIAGGLSTVADSNKFVVERMDDQHSRTVLEFPFDAKSRSMTLHDGDIVRVQSIVPRFSNAVTLRGNVVNPGRYPWKPGMKVRDLIPDAQSLLTRNYWLDRADMADGRSTEYPIRPLLTGEAAKKAKSDQNSTSSSDSSGSSNSSGSTSNSNGPMGSSNSKNQSSLTAEDLGTGAQDQETAQKSVSDELHAKDAPAELRKKKLNSDTVIDDMHRASPEINWSYAIVQRVNPRNLSISLLSFDLGKAVLEGDPASNLELQPDDIITVFAQSDIEVPQSARARYVRVEGEVAKAGVYKVEEGEMLRDVLRRAGGLTPDAYIYGTMFTRQSAKDEQQRSIEELTSTLEVDVQQGMSSAAAASTTTEDTTTLAALQGSQQALIRQLKKLKATGRVVLDLNANAKSIDDFPSIVVEDNDRIVIPHTPSTVSVEGMVYNPGSFVFDPHRKAGDYLRVAGKGKPNADMHHAFLLRADGSVVPRTAVNGLFSGDRFATLHLHPGDEIIVPVKIQTGNFQRNLRDWATVASGLTSAGAITALLVK
jgi:protein involved in polysaccharide export with SLBB domain